MCSLPVGDRMEGKTVTIINRSEIVGRPLGALLANDGESLRYFSFMCVHSHPLCVSTHTLCMSVPLLTQGRISTRWTSTPFSCSSAVSCTRQRSPRRRLSVQVTWWWQVSTQQGVKSGSVHSSWVMMRLSHFIVLLPSCVRRAKRQL